MRFKLLLIALFLFSPILFASEQSRRIELGLGLQYLVPNQLPDFDLPLSSFGAEVGIPLGLNTLKFQGTYGGSEIISLTLIEAEYVLNIPTPFLTAFILGGGHYVHYGYRQNDHTLYGPVSGFGFYLPMAKDFRMGMNMKFYLTEKLMLSFGGAFTVLL